MVRETTAGRVVVGDVIRLPDCDAPARVVKIRHELGRVVLVTQRSDALRTTPTLRLWPNVVVRVESALT